MKKVRLTIVSIGLILFASLFQGCNVKCVTGSGNQVTETRQLEPFTRIEASGAFKLVLKQDSSQTVTVTADDNIQQDLRLRVSGNKLHINMGSNFCNASPITITLHARSFEGIDLSGAINVESEGSIKTGDFDLELSGSSKIRLDLDAATIRTHSSGSSVIALKGQAGKHEVDMSGAGEIDALDFVTGIYTIKTAGATKCRINVLNKLSVNSSGASAIEYRGNPASVTNNDSGASSLKKIE